MQIQINRQDVQSLLQESLRPQNNQLLIQNMEKARRTSGFCLQLLVIADDKSLHIDVRQTALVTLKTTIDSYYSAKNNSNDSYQISDTDKDSLRMSILDALQRNIEQTKLVPTIVEIIYLIAFTDYPTQWDVTDKIANCLSVSQDFSQIYSNLLALKSIVSVFNTDENRSKKSQLVTLMIKTFPPLQTLSSKLMTNYSDITQILLLTILKIFGYATYMELVPNLRNSTAMHAWFIFIKKLLDFHLQAKSPNYQKIKKRALKILLRFVQRHANPNYDLQYSQVFMTKYAGPFLESVVLILMSSDAKKEIHNTALMTLPYFYKHFQNCRGLLDQHKQKLIVITIRKCFLTPQDQALWTEDPVQFINKQKDDRKALVEFVRSYSDCASIVVNQLANAFNQGNDNIKQIIMYMFSEMRNEIIEQITEQNILVIFNNFIFKELKSGPILKSKACQVISSYVQDITFPLETVKALTTQMYECFNSNHLQTRVPAAKAIASIIQKYQQAIPMLQPYLTNILQGYLVVSEKVDSQQIVYSLQKIINKLSDSIQPFALDLFKALDQLFFRYCERLGYLNDQDGDEQQDEDNPSNTCLGSIRTILLANLPQSFYQSVSSDIYRIVSFTFSQKTYNFLEEGLNILNLYLFKININTIHQDFLKLFPLLCYMITKVPQQVLSAQCSDLVYQKMIANITQGVDQTIVENVIGSMRNFIAKSSVDFLSLKDITNTSFIDRILQTVSCIKNSGSYADMGYISTLLTTIIENHVGNVDNIVAIILKLAIDQIRSDKITPKLLQVYLQIVFICLYYNSKTTLTAFDQNKCTQFIFKGIISNPQLFKTDFEKKRLVIGLLQLFQLDQNIISQSSVATFVPDLIKLMVDQSILATDQRENNAKSQDSECEQDQNTINQLTNNELQQQQEQDSNQWQSQYNKLYQSPLDNINEVVLLGNFLQQKGQIYLQYLSNDMQIKLSAAIEKANNHQQNIN